MSTSDQYSPGVPFAASGLCRTEGRVNLLQRFGKPRERLRSWLIRTLAGDVPVILNCHITVPTTLAHPGLYVGNRRAIIVLSDIASSDEMWQGANGVIETD
jgi:hypothetical protein